MNKRRDIIIRKELGQQGRYSNICKEKRMQRRNFGKKQGILPTVTKLFGSVGQILIYQMCARMTSRGGLTRGAGTALRVPRKPEKVVENPVVVEGVLIEEKQREEKKEEGKELVKVVGGVQDAVLR